MDGQRLLVLDKLDPKLLRLVLDFSKAQFAGASTALNLAQELVALRESGKPVIAFSERLTTASYLMAAQADKIFVHPSGAVAISAMILPGISGSFREPRPGIWPRSGCLPP